MKLSMELRSVIVSNVYRRMLTVEGKQRQCDSDLLRAMRKATTVERLNTRGVKTYLYIHEMIRV